MGDKGKLRNLYIYIVVFMVLRDEVKLDEVLVVFNEMVCEFGV